MHQKSKSDKEQQKDVLLLNLNRNKESYLQYLTVHIFK